MDIGGARVRRAFTACGRRLVSGDLLTGDEVRSLPVANRNALIENRFLEIWPAGPTQGKRFLVHLGRGKYDVIEGRKVNAVSVTKEEAEALVATGSAVH